MKRLTKISIMLLLFVGVMFTSCDKDDTTVITEPSIELMEVSFDIANYFPDVAAKGTPKDNVPECVDGGVPTTALIKLGGIDYTLDILPVNEGMETEVLKLAEGTYPLTSFVVLGAQGETLHAATNTGSDYANAWPELTSLPFDVVVEGFTKKKFEVDVLCYQPYDYVNFGFAWFEYAEYEIKTICFFGDVCSKFWETWKNAKDSPYANSITGYDFRAGFMVELFTADGTAINTGNSNIYSPDGIVEADGSISPLCVEYPHMVGSTDVLTFKLSLLQPDGTYDLIYTGTFDSGDMSDPKLGDDSFGGADGVFDFVVGNCSADDTDAHIDEELPAWLGLPDTVSMKVTNPTQGSYLDVEFDKDIVDLAKDVLHPAWCGNKELFIYPPNTYTSVPYNSLDFNSLPVAYQAYGAKAWSVLNYIVNNYDLTNRPAGISVDDVQNALWNLLNDKSYGESDFFDTMKINNGLKLTEDNIIAEALNYVPPVGGYAVVILDPQQSSTGQDFQIMVVTVDP